MDIVEHLSVTPMPMIFFFSFADDAVILDTSLVALLLTLKTLHNKGTALGLMLLGGLWMKQCHLFLCGEDI